MGSHSFLCFVVFLYCCVLIGAGEVCLVVILFILLADRQLCNRSLSFVIVEVYMIGLHSSCSVQAISTLSPAGCHLLCSLRTMLLISRVMEVC